MKWQYWVGQLVIGVASASAGGLLGWTFWYIGIDWVMLLVVAVCTILVSASNIVWIELCKRKGWYSV